MFLNFHLKKAQTGWSQHDYGHLSVFRSSKMNRFFHLIFIGVIKGASADWWKFLHNRHHAKPNVVSFVILIFVINLLGFQSILTTRLVKILMYVLIRYLC